MYRWAACCHGTYDSCMDRMDVFYGAYNLHVAGLPVDVELTAPMSYLVDGYYCV